MKLNQAQQIAETLRTDLRPFCERIEICGSIRRKKPDPKDIELIAIPKFTEIGTGQRTLGGEELSTNRNMLFDFIATHFHIIKAGARYLQMWVYPDDPPAEIKVDLFTATPETWGYILMIRTGPAEFSKVVVTKLKRFGYRSENGRIIKDIDQKMVTIKEADVFDMLRIGYIEPEDRGAI